MDDKLSGGRGGFENTPASDGPPHAIDQRTVKLGIAAVVAAVLVLGALYLLNQRSEQQMLEDRQNVLLPPEASGIGGEDYENLVARLAERADTLVIGPNCAMSPLVLELTEGETLTIQNDDQYIRTIHFESRDQFTVSPSRSREINLKEVFDTGAGSHRYGCGDLSRTDNTGVLYIVE